MLINPYIYAKSLENDYSMQMIRTTTSANVEYLKINNKSNAIDTALRDTTPTFSLSGWFKVDSAASGTERIIFSKWEDYAGYDRCITFRINASNKIQVYGQYDQNNATINLITTATYTAEEWNHFVFVYNYAGTDAGTIAQLYINGSLVTAYDTQTVNTTKKYFYNQTTESSRANVTIGCDYFGASPSTPVEGYGGQVDEFTFWDKSLSSTEAAQIYNSGTAYDVSKMTAYSTNCLAWYRMGDSAGDAWDGSKWTIDNAVGSATTEDLISVNLLEADRLTDVPTIAGETNVSGGTVTYDGLYTIRTFTSSGNLVVSVGSVDIEYLLIGGGGGGGTLAGGGGGGYLSGSTTLTSGTYSIVVGSGGTAVVASTSRGRNGGNSTFNGNTAYGGGGGGYSGDVSGYTGGCGAGGTGAGNSNTLGGGAGGTQGGNGGNGYWGTVYYCGGGGGGTGANGADATTASQGTGGAGGTGKKFYATYYGGGGGGSSHTTAGAAGGTGGGGAGAKVSPATNGTAGTDGLGGGGGGDVLGGAAKGGSGVVIIRHLTSS